MNLKQMDPEDAVSGPEASPAEAEGATAGKRRGKMCCAEHGEVTSRGFQHHEQGTAVPFTPDNHLGTEGGNGLISLRKMKGTQRTTES